MSIFCSCHFCCSFLSLFVTFDHFLSLFDQHLDAAIATAAVVEDTANAAKLRRSLRQDPARPPALGLGSPRHAAAEDSPEAAGAIASEFDPAAGPGRPGPEVAGDGGGPRLKRRRRQIILPQATLPPWAG